MTKTLSLALKLRLKRYDDQVVVDMLVESSAVAGWCLGLMLLKEQLITALLIQPDSGKKSHTCRLEVLPSRQMRSQAILDSDTVRISLSINNLEYILSFFLKYFRDGIADVDHIDLEADSPDGEDVITITLKVPDSIEPVSPGEARRRLGLH